MWSVYGLFIISEFIIGKILNIEKFFLFFFGGGVEVIIAKEMVRDLLEKQFDTIFETIND